MLMALDQLRRNVNSRVGGQLLEADMTISFLTTQSWIGWLLKRIFGLSIVE
jgi:hypothetical protein